MLPRSSSWALKPPKDKPHWKPKKTKDPDVGSYDFYKSKDKCLTRNPNYTFNKSKSQKFTSEIAARKKFVPGCGHYKVEKCYSAISIPYMKKRY